MPLLALSLFSLILFIFRPSIIGLFGMLLQKKKELRDVKKKRKKKEK